MRALGEVRKVFIGNKDAAVQYISEARKLLGEVKRRMSTGIKLQQLILRKTLSSGVQITAQSIWGQDAILINVPIILVKGEEKLEEFADCGLPSTGGLWFEDQVSILGRADAIQVGYDELFGVTGYYAGKTMATHAAFQGEEGYKETRLAIEAQRNDQDRLMNGRQGSTYYGLVSDESWKRIEFINVFRNSCPAMATSAIISNNRSPNEQEYATANAIGVSCAPHKVSVLGEDSRQILSFCPIGAAIDKTYYPISGPTVRGLGENGSITYNETIDFLLVGWFGAGLEFSIFQQYDTMTGKAMMANGVLRDFHLCKYTEELTYHPPASGTDRYDNSPYIGEGAGPRAYEIVLMPGGQLQTPMGEGVYCPTAVGIFWGDLPAIQAAVQNFRPSNWTQFLYQYYDRYDQLWAGGSLGDHIGNDFTPAIGSSYHARSDPNSANQQRIIAEDWGSIDLATKLSNSILWLFFDPVTGDYIGSQSHNSGTNWVIQSGPLAGWSYSGVAPY